MATLSEKDCFICRELSWLKFDMRVMETAARGSVPVLERLKFLGIYYSNLDEFFMVRVGSLTHRAEMWPEVRDIKTGWDAETQLKNIFREVRAQQDRAEDTYRRIVKKLSDCGVEVVDFRHISKVDESVAKKIYSEIKSLLSPNIVDAQHPWPFLGNLEEYTAVMLGPDDKPRIGIISHMRLPAFRVYEVNGVQKVFIMSELIKHFSPQIFKRYTVKEAVTIRVTRNADIFADDSINEWDDEDFRRSMINMLKKRKRMLPVRLQICGTPSQKMLDIFQSKLPINERNIFITKVPMNISFGSLLRTEPDMKYPPRSPVRSVLLRKGDYFSYLRKNDLLMSFPYQSISPFIEMLYEAADDPDVISIKITLYRLASSSKLAAALAYAADRGKDVRCMLELRARFDEQSNIDYSEMLTEAGCRVFYGLKDYKVHCKVCSIVRETASGEEYFTQIGTGNYNEVTSEQYCDLSLMTSDPEIGKDACALFDSLEAGELPGPGNSLMIAPNGFKSRIIEMMEEQRLLGRDGSISIKVNSMNDVDIMRKLIECSQAGVRTELFIRGICCLKPGIDGLTENISVKSVVGRYLEHSRIFIFGKGDARKIYMGSGDLLNRNTQRRVEVFVPVTTRETVKDVLECMKQFRSDSVTGWRMLPTGEYERDRTVDGIASHTSLYNYFSQRIVEPEIPPEKKGLIGRIKDLFNTNKVRSIY